MVRANRASKALSAKLEDYWLGIRLKETEIPAAHLLVVNPKMVASELPTIEDALSYYLSSKGQRRGRLFFQHARRNVEYLTQCLGNRSLDRYTTADAGKLRDWLIDKGLSSGSLLRIFGGIKAVVNFTIMENGLECRNPFAGVYLPNDTESRSRHPISNRSLEKLQQECLLLDDDVRWLVALISDTGLRLSEAVGLMIEDLVLEGDTPHLSLKPHEHRRLKTANSERTVPLVGMSLWAAMRVANSETSPFCFPRYASFEGCKSNSASAAINKWMKPIVGSKGTIHGLRHSFRDRLRAVEAPMDMIDQLGGWSLRAVGQNYGLGYQMPLLHKWMKKIELLKA